MATTSSESHKGCGKVTEEKVKDKEGEKAEERGQWCVKQDQQQGRDAWAEVTPTFSPGDVGDGYGADIVKMLSGFKNV